MFVRKPRWVFDIYNWIFVLFFYNVCVNLFCKASVSDGDLISMKKKELEISHLISSHLSISISNNLDARVFLPWLTSDMNPYPKTHSRHDRLAPQSRSGKIACVAHCCESLDPGLGLLAPKVALLSPLLRPWPCPATGWLPSGFTLWPCCCGAACGYML